MKNPALFFSSAELITQFGDETDRLYIERTFEVKKLKEIGTNATIYDPKIKLYFEDKSALRYLFEIDLKEIDVTTSEYLSKSADYLRRIQYRYDWIQPTLKENGKISSVENNKDLKITWERLKDKIRDTYKDNKIEEHFSEIDLEFDKEEAILPALYQYTHFGLLFPHIPQSHSEKWEQRRDIELSEYEKEKFTEKTDFVQLDGEGTRVYRITGEAKPDCQFTMNRYKGVVKIPQNELFPVHTEVAVEFQKEDIINKWYFKLIQYTQEWE